MDPNTILHIVKTLLTPLAGRNDVHVPSRAQRGILLFFVIVCFIDYVCLLYHCYVLTIVNYNLVGIKAHPDRAADDKLKYNGLRHLLKTPQHSLRLEMSM